MTASWEFPMAFELLLPGSVMILKSLLRLAIDQQVTGIRLAKAMLFLPVDISFLSISYATASLVIGRPQPPLNLAAVMGLVVIYVVLSVVITLVCSKSDRAFDAERNLFTVLTSMCAYAVSLSLLGVTLFGNVL
jgi:hypothetical protein